MRTRTLVALAGLLATLVLASGLETYTAVERKHWAFGKRTRPQIPTFSDATGIHLFPTRRRLIAENKEA